MRPALPPQLARMPELAYNVLWNWDATIRNLFRRLDLNLWRVCGHNPVLMLGRVPLGAAIWGKFPILAEWIMTAPNAAATRGILIGVSLGALAMSLRILLGIERTYLS